MRTTVVFLAAAFAFAAAPTPDPVSPDFESVRPIEALDTVFLEEMTWMEVRDAMRDGTKSIIVATGGVEQNGPYLAAGKHNYVLQGTTEAIARKLGNTLVAPIVPFVPEGDFDPPTVHMKYPTTISVTEETYQALLTDICRSLQVHGFEEIILIGDSGGNQKGLEAVAKNLNEKWAGGKTKLYYIPEYYDFAAVGKYLADNGVNQTNEGLHDDFGMTAMMMAVDPTTVRAEQRMAAGKFKINGVSLAPMENTIAWGKRLIDFRADKTIEALNKARKAAK